MKEFVSMFLKFLIVRFSILLLFIGFDVQLGAAMVRIDLCSKKDENLFKSNFIEVDLNFLTWEALNVYLQLVSVKEEILLSHPLCFAIINWDGAVRIIDSKHSNWASEIKGLPLLPYCVSSSLIRIVALSQTHLESLFGKVEFR